MEEDIPLPPKDIRVLTKCGYVTITPEEKKRLDDISKREGKTSEELINNYLE